MARQTPLYVSTNGYVAALNPVSGEELWRTKLPKYGSTGDPVAVLIKGDYLFAAAHGRAWGLSKSDGAVLWMNGLPKMGYHCVLLAMEGAEAGSGVDAVVVAEHRREQQRRAAAAAAAGAAAS